MLECIGGRRMAAQHNNYGFWVSLALHLIILMIPVSMAVSRHFKEVELFVADERPVRPLKEKIVKPKPKEMPEEIEKEVQPQPVIAEPEIKEMPTPKVIEPAVASNRMDAAPFQPASEPTPQVVMAPPKPLLDVEFGSSNAPKFLHREMPVYPLIARRLGKEGRVLLRLTIDEKGNLLNIEVLEGAGYGFTEAAVEAVKKSTFTPAIVNGMPVMSKALLSVKFSIRRD
jgi:protein TonB